MPQALPELEVVASGDLTGAVGADVLAVPVAAAAAGESDPQPRAGTADAAAATGLGLADVCRDARFTGAAGAVLAVPLLDPGRGLPPLLLLVGTGDGTPASLRKAGAGLARATRGRARVATTLTAQVDRDGVRAVVEGLLLAAWAPPWTGVGSGPEPGAARFDLLGCRQPAAVARAGRTARAVWTARDLTAMPSSAKTPAWVAEQAREACAGVPGLECEVLEVPALAAAGFGGLLAVGAASASPPCLVRMTWTPPRPAARGRHVVLVGKGVTFDTGGLSIKPREAMVPMKTDMAGAAVVLATIAGAEEAGCPHRVTALLPLAENAVGASAYRPGDVVTVYGGTTVEIANTDAEGRMLLADALAYADERLDPDVLVDVATLTGAASLGLGRRHGALYSADDRLAAALVEAGQDAGEPLWRMPLVEEYRPTLDSSVADLRHVPGVQVGGGSITAALFLREFAGNRRWVHLDIAGPARSDGERHEVPKGATGYGVRLLLRWLESLR